MTPANWLQLALALLGVAQACLLVSVFVLWVRLTRAERLQTAMVDCIDAQGSAQTAQGKALASVTSLAVLTSSVVRSRL